MIHRLLLAACFCAALLPFNAFCEAEVVDDSENYALLEERQATYESPVAQDDREDYNSNDEQPLAKDEPQAKYGRATSNNSNNASLLDKVQSLQQEVQELRGQLDVQAHDLKLLQEQQLSFYKDLDARLRDAPIKGIANKSAPAAVSIGEKPSAPQLAAQTPPVANHSIQPVIGVGRANPADEQISYLAAYDLIKNKHYDEAITAMQTCMTKYPHGGYTANAQYWLGELYIVKKNYPQAIAHFNVVLQEFPSSSKNAASLLKIGYALADSGKSEEARAKLREVIKTYPDTSTAQLATTRLDTLKNK